VTPLPDPYGRISVFPGYENPGRLRDRDSLNGDSLLEVLVNLDLIVQCFLLHPAGPGVSWFPAFILDTPSKIQ
jgi:hypothetical protein